MQLIKVLGLSIWILSISSFAQSQTAEVGAVDTVILYQYFGGKPDIRYVRAKKRVLNSIGVATENFFGDCGGTYDYKYEEFQKKNLDAAKFLKSQLGDDWKNELDRLVHAEME